MGNLPGASFSCPKPANHLPKDRTELSHATRETIINHHKPKIAAVSQVNNCTLMTTSPVINLRNGFPTDLQDYERAKP